MLRSPSCVRLRCERLPNECGASLPSLLSSRHLNDQRCLPSVARLRADLVQGDAHPTFDPRPVQKRFVPPTCRHLPLHTDRPPFSLGVSDDSENNFGKPPSERLVSRSPLDSKSSHFTAEVRTGF